MATRGTLTSSFTRKTPRNASLKLKDPANLHLEQSPSSHCLCSINVSREETSPDRSCNDSSEDAVLNEEDGDFVKKEYTGDVSGKKKKERKKEESHTHTHIHTHSKIKNTKSPVQVKQTLFFFTVLKLSCHHI